MTNYQKFDPLDSIAYEALKADIAARGVLVPIEKDELGNVLDGYHRTRICEELGITDYPVVIRAGLTEEEKLEHLHKINTLRRHMTAKSFSEQLDRCIEMVPDWSDRRIAEILGVDHKTVAAARARLEDVGKIPHVETRTDSNGRQQPARKPKTVIATSPEQAQTAAADLLELGWDDSDRQILTASEVIQESRKTRVAERLNRQREEIADKCHSLPVGRYACLVIDPPWEMQKIEREERPNQVGFDYPTMSYDELLKFPLADSAADDAHLYLWTTQKHLPFSFQLAEAWGFRYQCLMTWVKNVGFTPFSWMYSTEHVLFCTRGHLPLQRLGRRLDFSAKVREHSRKPDEFYNLVREVSPGPRIDIFSREVRDGFETWGSEAGKFTAQN